MLVGPAAACSHAPPPRVAHVMRLRPVQAGEHGTSAEGSGAPEGGGEEGRTRKVGAGSAHPHARMLRTWGRRRAFHTNVHSRRVRSCGCAQGPAHLDPELVSAVRARIVSGEPRTERKSTFQVRATAFECALMHNQSGCSTTWGAAGGAVQCLAPPCAS